jgi:hypothetical protein
MRKQVMAMNELDRKMNVQEADRPPSKLKTAMAMRTKRERTMIYLLIVIAIGAILIYFAVLPGFTKYSALMDEIEQLEDRESLYRTTIAKAGTYGKMYADAKVAWEAAQTMYYRPMDPESLDRTITGLLIDAGFEPDNLSMSSLISEAIPSFAPPALQEMPFTTAGAVEETGEEPAADDGTGDPASEPSSFVYTIKTSVSGSLDKLYTLLDTVKDMNGIKITSYTYMENDSKATDEATGEVPEGDRSEATLIFKVYVFVEGA